MILLLILSICNNCILLVFNKWRIIERYDLHKKSWFPDWCDLCFFFWCSMIERAILSYFYKPNLEHLFYAVVASLASTFISLILNKVYYRL